MVLLLLAGLVFVVLGFWVLLGGADASRRSFGLVGNRIFGLVAIAFFGLISGFLLKKIIENKPALSIGKDGFTDNSSAMPADFIAWENIQSIAFMNIGRQKFLVVNLHEAKDYMEKGNFLQKWLKKKNTAMTGGHVMIAMTSLLIKREELLEIFKTHIDKIQ